MADGNGKVLQFPSGNAGGSSYGFGATATPAAQAPQGQQGQSVPALQASSPAELNMRLSATLNLARKAAKRLIDKAIPGTVPIGLFNQYGIIQSALAELGTRVEQATDATALQSISEALQPIELQAIDFGTAVDQAIAAGPAIPEDKILGLEKVKAMWIGGGLAVTVVATGAYLYLRKPSRRRKLAGLFGAGTAAAAEREPARKPRRKARRKKR